MDIQIKVDTREIERFLKGMQKQIPYAIATALNKTAFDVRKEIVEKSWPESVNAKNKRFARTAFRVKKATKRDLTASVYDSLGRDVFDRLIHGKPHIPYSGTHLAIPVAPWLLTKSGYLSKRGRQYLNPGNAQTFVKDHGHGPAIWLKKKRGGIELLYVLKPKVRTPKKFDFYKDAEKAARRHWKRNMEAALAHAIRTAK